MLHSYQREVAEIFQKLKDRQFASPQQRSVALKNLKNIISNCTNAYQFTDNWQGFFEDLSFFLSCKISVEVKRQLGDVAMKLVLLIPSEYKWILDWSLRNYGKLPEKLEGERAIVLKIMTNCLNEINEVEMHGFYNEQIISECFEFILNHLENMNQINHDTLLEALLGGIKSLSINHQRVFRQLFKKVSTTIFTWSLEQISTSLISRCHNLLASFVPFWPENIELMKQLITDYLAEIEPNVREYIKKNDSSLQKNRGIIQAVGVVFGCFVKTTLEESQWSLDKMSETLKLAETCSSLLGNSAALDVGYFMASFTKIYEKILLLKTNEAKSLISQSVEQTMTFAERYIINHEATIEIFEFFAKVLKIGDPSLNLKMANLFLGQPNGIFFKIILYPLRKQSLRVINRTIAAMVRPISIKQLQDVFQLIKNAMLASFKVLKEAMEGKTPANKIALAEKTLFLLTKALENLAMTKNSLIVIMGLDPSLLKVLCQEMPICQSNFEKKFPLVYRSFLQLIIKNCQSHDYFLATSDWLTGDKPNESITSKHAQIQLQTITKFMQSGMKWKMNREAVANWLLELISRVDERLLLTLAKRKEWMELHWTVIKGLLENEVEESMTDVARRLGLFSNEYEKNISPIYTTVLEKVALIDPKKGNTVRSRIDSSLFIRASVSNIVWDSLEFRQIRALPSNFTGYSFDILSKFLLKRVVPTFTLNPSDDDLWMFEIIYSIYNSQNESVAPQDANKYIHKWRWALAQMALFCVENKMKTSLGKASETFAVIGSEIQRLGKVALRMEEDNRKPLIQPIKAPRKHIRDKDDNEEEYGNERELTDAEEWWRIRCLLEFVEIFDKMLFNAVSGAHYPLANITQSARQFFHANLSNCNEWLSRTYPFAMIVAFHAGYYSQVIRFGSSALIDLEKRQRRTEQIAKEAEMQVPVPSPNTLAVIILIARAMAELGSAQAAKGLKNWTAKLYKIEANWLDGAVEMAAARYESALKYLIHSLHHENLPETLKIHIRAMIFDILNRLRLPTLLTPLECPAEMNIWTEAEKLNPVPEGFDADAFRKLTQLSIFAKVDNISQANNCWDINDLIYTNETQLMQTLRRTEVLEMKDDITKLGHLVFITDSGLRSHGRIATMEKILTSLAAKMNKKYREADNVDLDADFLGFSNTDIGERLNHARKLCFWSERLDSNRTNYEQPAILARKTENYLLAEELLKKFEYVSLPSSSMPRRGLIAALERAKMQWKSEDLVVKGSAWTQTFLALDQALLVENVRQQQHMMFASNNVYMNGMNPMHPMNGLLSPGARLARISPDTSKNYSTLMSKSALKLAKWIQEDQELLSNLSPEILHSQLWMQMESDLHFGGDYSKFLLSLAAQVTPTMAKAHLKLADWYYKNAKNEVALIGKDNFFRQYKAFISNVSEDAISKLWDLLFTAESSAELTESINKIVDSNTATFLLTPGGKYLEAWNNNYLAKVNLLTGAINSYFSYISQLGVKNQNSKGSVSATLRILGLLVDYPDTLFLPINEGFSQTNELLWKDILPQLFSRLSHPNENVREAIVSLIAKICISAPHCVVFQVVSGSFSFSSINEDDDVVDAEESEEREYAKKEKTLMFESCQVLKQILQEAYPSLVTDVQLFINELQKISLLNEEKWAFVLSNLDYEMGKRLEQIKKETERTNNSTNLESTEKAELVSEKTELITSSVYRILKDLYDRTCVQNPSTLNEEQFITEFGPELKKAFEQSKNPAKNPEKAWAPFRELLSLLQQKSSRRGAQFLNIQDISVVLSNLKSTAIPLPGQENADSTDVVTLASVGATAQILPTKTRPKKMMFVGSDGKEHTFLFKGQEDLHLDERIMQLLQICNLLLASPSKRSWPSYTARHYAVTPLGPRSGLIQWVGGATPLFFLYRRWQQRNAQMKEALEKKNGVVSSVQDVERPTDLFQKARHTAFLKYKIKPDVISDRTKWPPNVMKEVFFNLSKETPKDLISRELWMKAGSSDTWWRATSRMARSTAVNSIIGAILGLGDRHLDNLLINLDKGEVIHIDYNICFDKGKTLRVPETVPFRLTQNIVHAMGPTQIEGVFRESCCHVLENLRSEQEFLLTILEAFIYDPLVDWASSDHLTISSAAVSVAVALAVYGNDSRIQDAKPIARKMFLVRRKEYGALWLKNYNESVTVLEGLQNILVKLINGGTAWEGPTILEERKIEGKRRLQQVLSDEQQMMKHFRPLMKALATCDERFNSYLKNYKESFHHPVMKVFHLLDSQNTEDLKICLEKLRIVQNSIFQIYHDVLNIDMDEIVSTKKSSNLDGMTPPPGFEERVARAEQQEQNLYAQNAVKRVRSRLEGKTEDKGQLSVEEQVDYFISNATSSSKLSLMYEGWTAWV